ncbi:F-box protein SKIP5 [Glycine soja]|uniref:F-box protein SKIP5 n=2 Tax=Glycine soja TaxID=3848 RepID=A0A445I3B2_GLYSO|nr:F-box protein SKIP5 [Glycine soja]
MKISNAWIDKSQTGPKSKEGHGVGSSQNIMEYQQQKQQWKRSQRTKPSSSSSSSHINNLDDGCLMHIFNFLPPIPDRFNTALVCHRWNYLACHPRLWLRVDRSVKELSEPGVFPNIETAVSASRPGDTILIAAGGTHRVANIQIRKPLCLIGAGEVPDDTTLVCSRGSDSALEFLSTCKLANLTVRAELGCCLLHRKGRLTIDGCILQCESNPLDYLSCPIVSTASSSVVLPSQTKSNNGDGVFVSQTRIEGGAKAVLTSGDLALQRVRVIYARTSLLFWFDVEQMCDQIDYDKPL